MRRLAAAVLIPCAFLVTGCFDIEQTLTLERNLSGQAGFTMKVDMEPMVGFMAMMQHQMSGKSGDPTPAEIAAAKKDFLANAKKDSPVTDFEKEKKDLQSKLPKGVTLIDAKATDEGLKMTVSALFGFDNVSKLSQITLPKKDDGGKGGPGGENPMETPFDSLKVTDEGGTILVTSKVENPMSDAKDEMSKGPADPAMQKQIADMFKGLRVAFKITSPLAVVEHNATRKEGNTLIWEYDMKTLSAMTPAKAKEGIRVRYKK
jgi:hypothetical protein